MNEKSFPQTAPVTHEVPGFDPVRYLRRAAGGKTPDLRQLLQIKRLWFRLACPNGRMLLNPLRITDRLAIFEAKIFFSRDDPEAVSSFTATKTSQEAPGYIRAAQDEALSEALDSAGFGIRLCDAEDVPPAVEPVRDTVSTPSLEPVVSEQTTEEAAPEPENVPAAPENSTILEFPAAEPQKNVAEAAPETIESGYTDDLPVDEICRRMTLEEARAVQAPRGPCAGWTMAQVAERRLASLRFYLTEFSECSNIQKAAATLVLRALEQAKAG